MNLDDLKKLNQFPARQQKKKNKILVSDVIDYMNRYYQQIKSSAERYDSLPNDLKEMCKGHISNSFNLYTQSFMDAVDILMVNEGMNTADTSLRRYCREYDAVFEEKTPAEQEMLSYIITRNDIIHDYINIDVNQEEELNKFYNYVDGLLDINRHLLDYFAKRQMLGDEIR